MKDGDFWVSMEPVEDRYGGGYRTRHVILKRRHASLAFSVYSCRLHDKMAPNRDYMSEGLCSFINGESWKFIDAIAIGLKVDGALRELKPEPVRACPWECEYAYDAGEMRLSVSYYLYNAGYGGAGIMKARADGAGPGVSIVFEPFFDIRPEGAPPGHEGLEAEVSNDVLQVSVGERAACARLEGGELRETRHMVEWEYKLGRGNRAMMGERVRPVPETRNIASFYELEAQGKRAELRFSSGASRKDAQALLAFRSTGPQEDLMLAKAMRESVFPQYGGTDMERAMVWRTLGMARFGMDFEGVKCIEAGGLLSRKLLFRDQFEGLLHNYHAVKKMHGLGCIKDILLKAYELQDRWGRVPARFSHKLDYVSADATLIAFILAGVTVRDTNDVDFARCSAEAFKKYFTGVCACDLMPEGPPMVKPNGLVSVGPALAWVDGHRMIEEHRVAERVSLAWAQELISCKETEELRLQKYLLPEVNARWIRCLEAGWLFSKYIRDFQLADRCKMFYYRALDAYKNIFYNDETGFINNMVTTDDSRLGRRSDPAVGSAGMVAAAILGTDVFTARELSRIAQITKQRLLRKKWGLPFGAAVMDGAACAYLDNEREYGGTVCPGDTPYLLKLLRMMGDRETADLILEANLRHQMDEGFVFYNNELFSCDHDLVPSRDPVRWWSQWVDPYLELRR